MRSEYFAQLGRLLDRAKHGEGSVALITGHVGFGKSTVLARFAERAEADDATVLQACASAAESTLQFGVLSQLHRACPEERSGVGRGAALLDDYMSRAVDVMDAPVPPGGPAWAKTVHGLWSTLLAQSVTKPVVIVVDDIGYADEFSLNCLLYFARRAASARVLVALAELEHPHSAACTVHGELQGLRHFHSIRLAPLSTSEIATLLAGPSQETCRRLAQECHDLTGGNSRLVSSLLRDTIATSGRGGVAAGLTPGPTFGKATAASARACGPIALGVARGVALLEEWSSQELLSQLLDVDTASVGQALDLLTEVGLLADGGFRHPVAAEAIRSDMSPDDRCAMYGRTAEFLYSEGAPATIVAGHLLATGHAAQPWAVAVLEQAADEALSDDRLDLATASLKLALRACTDEDRRAVITVKLALARWRADPVLAARYHPVLMDALRRRLLHGRHATSLIRFLLWNGRLEDATEALEQLALNDQDSDAAVELRLAHVLLRHTYPSLAAHARHLDFSAPEHSHAGAVVQLQANTLLAAVLSGTPPENARHRIERILTLTPLNDLSLDTLQASLLALMYDNHADVAAHWCDRLLCAATERKAPSWRAVFAAIRAELDVRHGDLVGAEYHARTAFRLIGTQGWGAAVGGPRSSLIHALVASGRIADAAHELDQDLPQAALRSRFGLHFLAARGQYHAAVGDYGAALGDFLACGELMEAWDMDVASLVPWRSDAAEVYLRIGQVDRARELAHAQLDQHVNEGSREHGRALAVLAAAETDPEVRRCLHNDAVCVMERCGDRYGLARALAASAAAYLADDEVCRARADAERARDLARSIGAQPVLDSLRTAGLDALLPSADESIDAPPSRAGLIWDLSSAERKVARLAALGRTNRDIAAELFITVSTVEQHLTRVYRKLQVTRRMDLPPELHLSAVEGE